MNPFPWMLSKIDKKQKMQRAFRIAQLDIAR
jgi:hypothetical protein